MKKKILKTKNSNFFLLKKFETHLLKEGKQLNARKLIIDLFFHFKNLKKNPLLILETAISNVKPFFILKNKKKGKQKFILPIQLTNDNKRISLALKWVILNAKKHNENSLIKNLIKEISEASLNKGFSKQTQQEIPSLVLINRKQIQLNKNRTSLKFY